MSALAVLTGFSAGWLIAGVATAAAVLAIHWLSKPKARRLYYPAAWLLTRSAAAKGAPSRPRDLMLWFVRACMVIILALAFARPSLRTSHADLTVSGGTDWVLIVDSSASMMRRDDGIMLFDRARARAGAFLDGMDPSRDRAAVLLAAREPGSVLPRLSSNFAALRAAIADAAPTHQSIDSRAALLVAAELPSESDSPRSRRIVVFSDLQQTQWSDLPQLESCTIEFDHITSSLLTNRSIRDLRIQPARPIVGEPFNLSAEVANYSSDAIREVVTFIVEGESPTSVLVEVEPWSSTTVSSVSRREQTGVFSVEARLSPDAFTADDAAWSAAEVIEASQWAVITEADANSKENSAWFARAALEAASARSTPALRWSDVRESAIDSFDGAIIVQSGVPDDLSLNALSRFRSMGRALIWVVDSPESIAAIERWRTLVASGRAFEPPLLHGSADRQTLQTLHVNHHAHESSHAGGSFNSFEKINVRLASKLTLDDQSNYETPLVTKEGTAALILGRAAAGSIAFLAIDLSPDAGFVQSPMFPVLVEEIRDASRVHAGSGQARRIGEPVSLTYAGQVIEPVHDLEGNEIEVQTVRRTDTPFYELRGKPFTQPGIDRWTDAQGSIISLHAAELDPAESDPRTREDLQDSGKGAAVSARIAGTDQLFPLWPWLLLIVLGLMVTESSLVRRSSQSRRSEP